MRIKCRDGIVRSFSVARNDGDHLPNGTRQNGSQEARCEVCGALFGIHSTNVLKPHFKAHCCFTSTIGTRLKR